MMPLDIIGSTGAVQQGTRKRWTYFDGETEVIRYQGEKDAVGTLYDLYKLVAGSNPDYDSLDFDPGRGNAALLINKVSDGEALYELYANEMNRRVEDSPAFASLTATQVVDVYRVYNLGYDASALFAGDQLKLWQLLAKGVHEYLESGYVLRESKRVSKRSSVTAAFTGVNTVVSPPSVGAVNSLIGTLPDGEWLYRSPVVRMIGARRWEIQSEWWWATTWSAVLYGGTGSP